MRVYFFILLFVFLSSVSIKAQQLANASPASTPVIYSGKTAGDPATNSPNVPTATGKKDQVDLTEREKMLLDRIEDLEKRLREVEARTIPVNTGNTATKLAEADLTKIASPQNDPKNKPAVQISEEDRGVLDFYRDTTINFAIDGYYTFNGNRPYNRTNLLRAYDVSSNSFSLNQASVVIENAPNVEKGRRFGFRLDLQYGQATETLQGSPNNELRPNTFRPVWQAYGTYVAPVGKGLTVDFGKWASSLGYETNYTKDNFNYSRSLFFNYLPYYHFGIRASYPVTDKLTATYWLVNGAQQSEDFNGAKSQAILLNYKPTAKVILQGNYYVGGEQRDQQVVPGPGGNVRLTPKGKFHVLDAYATILLTEKLTFAIEGDYVVNRVNSNDAPSRVTGGAAYLRYQWTPKFALAGRTEYLSDRGGLFTGVTQALKEFTFTSEYKFAEGFLVRGEYRRDWSNRPYFLTNSLDLLKKEQNTATIGLVWWFGRKQGGW